MAGDRYPFAPLEARIGGQVALCDRLGIAQSTIAHYRAHGLSWKVADRLAVRAGYHPAQIWESWVDDGLTVLDRLHLEGGWRQAWLWREQVA